MKYLPHKPSTLHSKGFPQHYNSLFSVIDYYRRLYVDKLERDTIEKTELFKGATSEGESEIVLDARAVVASPWRRRVMPF